jgi:diguanylate cyclase
VPENLDWKEKYRTSVRELEAEEQRWRELEKALRRLVGRLCAAGMGTSDRLDTDLEQIAAANRRNADAAELAALTEALAVAASDPSATQPLGPQLLGPQALGPEPLGPPPLAAAHWRSTCAAVRTLLERLMSGDTGNPVGMALREELAAADGDAALAEVLLRMADVVHERSEQIARERLQAATVLSDVSKRLAEMVEYCATSADVERSNFAETESLSGVVMREVKDLTAGLKTATELASLQQIVGKALESVDASVREFRARAEERLLEQTSRTEFMRTRVAALEQEARDLHDKLALERDRARIDPLTGVANRKAFDERIAQEIARRKHTDASVILLVWDIDNFKSINDTYGHRAGDRVLQSVAQCFAMGIRSTDFVARIGGEEFAMVMIGPTLDTALGMANELRAAVEGLRFHCRGKPIRVTASCGITELKEREVAAAAFDRADTALYSAKHAGRNLCIAA